MSKSKRNLLNISAISILFLEVHSTMAKAQDVAILNESSIKIPSTVFSENAEITKDYDKYFYFYREETSFTEALSDLTECDAYARGLTSFQVSGNPYNSANGGGLGGAVIGGAMDAIIGSAKRRGARRANMRVCMGYKGYHRYGLPKQIWEQINFDEGNSSPTESDRQKMLMQQAKIASGPKPANPELN